MGGTDRGPWKNIGTEYSEWARESYWNEKVKEMRNTRGHWAIPSMSGSQIGPGISGQRGWEERLIDLGALACSTGAFDLQLEGHGTLLIAFIFSLEIILYERQVGGGDWR